MLALFKKWYRLFFLILFVATACLIFVVRGYHSQYAYLGGDEPNYVMMTESFILDGDFNLKNDYELDRPGKYYPERLFPQLPPIIDHNETDNWQSIHTIGLPLLLAIPYKLFGVVGARAFMMLLQLATVALFYCVLQKYLKSDIKVAIGLFVLYSTSIFWQNIGSIFPDFLVVTTALAAILLFGSRLVWTNFLFVGLMVIGYVAHTKIALIILPIFLAHHWLLIHEMGANQWLKQRLIFPALALGLALAYSGYLYLSYGIISPSQIYGANGQLFSANPVLSLLAIVTDRVKGLLVYVPGLVVAAAYGIFAAKEGFTYLAKQKGRLASNSNAMLLLGLIVGGGLYMLTQLGFNDWSGSYAPNGRYMLVLIFLGAFCIARYINISDRLQLGILLLVILINYILALPFIVQFDIYMDPGVSTFLTRNLAFLDYWPIFPPVVATTPRVEKETAITLAAVASVVSVLLYWLFAERNKTYEQSSQLTR